VIFKLGLYRDRKADIIRHVERHGLSSLSFYCATVGFPVAAALVFCMEEWPEKREELEKRLEKVREFYGYEQITE
jgi:hypothetical protein